MGIHWQLYASLPFLLTLSAKAFCVSAASVWNSLSYNCRSAELLSTFKRLFKDRTVWHCLQWTVNTPPTRASDSLGTNGANLIDWLKLNTNTLCLKKTVPTYILLLLWQTWTDFNKNWKDCSRRNPSQNKFPECPLHLKYVHALPWEIWSVRLSRQHSN